VPDLDFQVCEAEPLPFAAAPTIALKVRISNAVADEAIHTTALRCQIQIEATRRRYTVEDQRRLGDLFGAPERWAQTLKTMLWTHTSAVVGRFAGSTVVSLDVPCTFDFNVAATKYFAGLDDGEVPLCLQFSGTVFYEGAGGALQVAQIPWSKEARYRLPVRVWRDMMDVYYPNTAWLCLRRDAFERLRDFKTERGLPTFEQALERLLEAVEERAAG
jgi:hypothetical protein